MTSSSHNSDSPVPWILREDLQVFPAEEGSSAWTIKDPVRLNYFRVQMEEMEFLRALDGRRSLPAVLAQLQRQFPGLQLAVGSLASFLVSSIRSGLLRSTEPGLGGHLAAVAQQQRSTAFSRKLLSLISHRFRGIDPTPLLTFLHGCLSWMFRPVVLFAMASFVLTMTLLVLTRWNQLQAELPSMAKVFTLQNMVVIGGVIVVVRVLHELGHGLACRHYGGECHELGVIVVGVLPLLYCDVSDSWKQENRFYRVGVAAAGIAVELLLAAVCAALWMLSVPGLLHAVFLNVMLVCSLNTVLVNGNPLLRYDGYYVLSDLLRIPNLGPQSRQAMLGTFDRWVLGVRQPAIGERSLLQQLGLPLFGLVSQVFRWIVLATILLFIYSILKPRRLEALIWIPLLSLTTGLLLQCMTLVRQRTGAVREAGGLFRAAAGLSVFGTASVVLLFWPWPYSVNAPFSFSPGVSLPLYVSTPGVVQGSAKYGDDLESGQPVVHLSNSDVELALVVLDGELRQQESRLKWLTASRHVSSQSSMALPAAEQTLQSLRERLAVAKRQTDRLTVRSSGDGRLWPPRSVPEPTDQGPLSIRVWDGLPLDRNRRNVWLEERTLIGWVGRSVDLRAAVYVSQQDIEFVRESSSVSLTCTSWPGQPLSGKVVAVASQPETEAPAELVTAAAIATDGKGQLTNTCYVAWVQLRTSEEGIPPLYSTGTASIRCRPTSLAERLWRVLTHTFAFEL